MRMWLPTATTRIRVLSLAIGGGIPALLIASPAAPALSPQRSTSSTSGALRGPDHPQDAVAPPRTPASSPRRTLDRGVRSHLASPSAERRLAGGGPSPTYPASSPPFPTPTAPPAPPSPSAGFISRTGTQLALNGAQYHFTGINIYMAASGGRCGGLLYPNLNTPLSDIPHGSVIRFWAFQPFFVSGGSFDWATFDSVLSIAASYGDHVIPVLANQYAYCDSQTKTLAWYQSGYRTDVLAGDLVPYRQYVADVVSRYAGNPTIAMWQLVNEGEAVTSDGSCTEASAHSAMLSFSNDVGGLVHQQDKHHLVSLGTLAGYSGAGIQWCGAANGDFQTLMASSGNDVCDYHDYGYPTDPMGRPTAPDLASAISMCHADGKPIMVAETGILASNSSQLAPRASEFQAKFNAQFAAGVVGELMWEWANIPDYVNPPTATDYGIFPPSPQATASGAPHGDPSLAVIGHVYW